jgi:hypothetical protein
MPEKTTRSGVGEAWLAQRGLLCGLAPRILRGERTVATAKVGGAAVHKKGSQWR